MSKTFFIAGGAGFIGSNFVRFLREQKPNAKIIVFDALTYAGNTENLKDVAHNFVRGDVAQKEEVQLAFEEYNPDFVVNFAAETHVDRSILGPEIFVETNIRGTQNLLEAARKFGVNRYLQISTDEVYGDLGDTENTFFTEETPLAPNCPYAASKASADLLVRSYFETYKLPVLITRCTNNYGPYQFPEKLIPFFLTKILADESVPMYGDGKNIRDWLFVRDHCRAILSVLENGRLGEVYNIGGHNEKTNLEITKILFEKIRNTEKIEFVTDRLAHDRRYAMDASKIERELGWRPEFPFEVWIDQTIKWYLQNQEWIQKSLEKGKK